MSINEIKKQIARALEEEGFGKSQISVESRIVGIRHYVVLVIKDDDISKERIEDILNSFGRISIDNYPGRSFEDFCKVRNFSDRNRI